MKTKFEYTASGTPQQNSYAEMGFTALACRARAMMNMGNVPRGSCYNLFGKVAKTATKLDSLVIVDIDGVKKTQVKHYANISCFVNKELPVWLQNLLHNVSWHLHSCQVMICPLVWDRIFGSFLD